MMVPRVHIELSAPGINHLRLTQFGLKLIIAGGIALTVSFWWIGTTLHDKIDVLTDQTETIITQTRQVVAQAKSKGLDLSDHAIQNIPQHISFVKHVRDRVVSTLSRMLWESTGCCLTSLSM